MTAKNAGAILIFFFSDSCLTAGDCGLGSPDVYATFAYSGDRLRALRNYPHRDVVPEGGLIWNASGTKAIIASDTCGGAGCNEMPLSGYNLLTDRQRTITSLKAVNNQGPADVEGKPLSRWTFVKWINNSTFSATIVYPNGSKKLVSGKF